MTQAEAKLAELGISLPKAPAPVAAYIPVRVVSGLAYVSGQIPLAEGKLRYEGFVGQDVSLDDGIACARLCAINALAAVREAVGSLDRVAGVVRLGVFVACGAEFTDHAKVANGASELMQAVFGEAGRHARAAVGCSSLPLGAPVEVEATFLLADG